MDCIPTGALSLLEVLDKLPRTSWDARFQWTCTKLWVVYSLTASFLSSQWLISTRSTPSVN